ncbi:hypothetical protein EAG_02615 [Camponotus floridanus]|uniref:Uncharacterized protein n=1 Tax=Camponotus floridanus TaxID=104421 RepID=E2AYC7_CAMFO|nr:hypothetical protein EAG_02615 [Camponotus floridanus]
MAGGEKWKNSGHLRIGHYVCFPMGIITRVKYELVNSRCPPPLFYESPGLELRYSGCMPKRNSHITMLQILLLLSTKLQHCSNLLNPASALAPDCSQLHPFLRSTVISEALRESLQSGAEGPEIPSGTANLEEEVLRRTTGSILGYSSASTSYSCCNQNSLTLTIASDCSTILTVFNILRKVKAYCIRNIRENKSLKRININRYKWSSRKDAAEKARRRDVYALKEIGRLCSTLSTKNAKLTLRHGVE